MMAITAQMVKELRERTGAGMMECKKALTETNGDMEKAIEMMRKAGQAKADKKASRTTAEGTIVIATSADGKEAALVEVNCETDFVARDENFTSFANNVAQAVLVSKETEIAKLADLKLVTGEDIETARKNLITKIGENISVRRVKFIETAAGVLGAYSHSGRIGVIVTLEGGDQALAKDLAMHIAASNPTVVDPSEVPAELVEKEKEIFSAQAKESGKPEAIIEKMVEGRVRKFLDEVSLTGQPFVKDPNQKVSALLKANDAKVVGFIRYAVGEGIEKEETNFAEEVMSQVRGA
ncbi:translation elongation factor Ts [Thiotrichales bacterium 19S3-7]|nr:translation elongation factor Ts [Thiotrichales bacterium 19S3-7]MCF6800827.1 translation elongation factor Ts [Thiotrichales bacterium 19S3-11]